MTSDTLAVIGAGSWGTALAMLTAQTSSTVFLWSHNPDHIRLIKQESCNTQYLPGFTLSKNIIPTADLPSLLTQSRKFVIAVPSHAFRSTLCALRACLHVEPDKSWQFCWGTKGMEAKTGKLLDKVFEEIMGRSAVRAVLSGPSFSREVAARLPTALTVAADNVTKAEQIASWFRTNRTRVYTTTDLTGVQLGGAIKNVIAIAAGIGDGLGFGVNARAALISRGLAEMVRIGVALGGKPETFMGLAGIGDLILTCTDDQSRNRRLGISIAKGKAVIKAANDIGQEAEGIYSTEALFKKSKELGVNVPITEQVYGVLFEGVVPTTAVKNLLSREARLETG